MPDGMRLQNSFISNPEVFKWLARFVLRIKHFFIVVIKKRCHSLKANGPHEEEQNFYKTGLYRFRIKSYYITVN